MANEHAPEHPGADGLGYGRCRGCGELWPCLSVRGRPAPAGPDVERDARVAARRAADARRASAALDRLLAGPITEDLDAAMRGAYHMGWRDGHSACE